MTEVVLMGEADAQRLTERIRNRIKSVQESMDRLGELIAEAYNGGAWRTLGYGMWDEYVSAEFGLGQLKLERGQRQELVVSMRSAGMSTRAIGTALGVAKGTVDNDVANSGHLPTAPVVGLDGKTYTPPEPKPQFEPSGMDEFAASDEDEVVEGEVVEESTPEAISIRHSTRQRTDVVAVMANVINHAQEAAGRADQIKREHLKTRRDEAARWSRDLGPAIESLQRLAQLLEEAKQ